MTLKTATLKENLNGQTKRPTPPPAVSPPNATVTASDPLTTVGKAIDISVVVDQLTDHGPTVAETTMLEATLKEQIAAYDKTTREEYARYTSHLWEQRRDSQADADKLVLTLSSAFLALSASALKDLVPLSTAISLPLLFIGWAGFGFSVTSTLWSYHMSRKTIDEHIAVCRPYFFEGQRDAFDSVNKNKKLTEAINNISSCSFVAGLVFTLLFIGVNVLASRSTVGINKNSQTVNMAKPQTPKNRNIPLGAVPSLPPNLQRSPAPTLNVPRATVKPATNNP